VDVHPAPIGNDFVYLKGGGIIRGTLIEAIPNDHATVELVTGQSAVIPWDRIERIDRGASPTPAPRQVAPPAPAPPSRPSAVVHVESDTPVTLERRDGGRWVAACSSPCDEELPIGSEYRISGSRVRTSNDFRLDARPGDHVVVELSIASKGAFAGGIVLTSVGGFSLLLGAANADPYAQHDETGGTVGLVMVGAGAVSVLVGIILTASNRHSTVTQLSATPRPRNDAWLRLPTWRDARGHDDKNGVALGAGLPTPLIVPLFETRF
jgi:hypothetical protein